MADPTVKVVIDLDDSDVRKKLIRIATLLGELRTNARGVSGELKKSADEAARALEKQKQATDNVVKSTKDLGDSTKKTSGNVRQLSQSTSQYLRATLSTISGASQLAKQLVRQASAAGLTNAQVQSVAKATDAFSDSQISAIARSVQFTKRMDALNNELKEGIITTDAYAKRLKSLSAAFSDVVNRTKATEDSQKRLNDSQNRNQGTLSGLIGAYVRLRIALDAVRQIVQTVNRTFEFAEQGAQIQQVRLSFNAFANEIAGIPDLLNKLTEAADGTVSEFQLMTSTLTLTAGVAPDVAQTLANASPRLLEVARAAAIINPALGDTQVLFDRLALGIKRSSSRILDDLGIIVKLGEANERFAASIGKTVKELTAEERQIALLNETLRAGQNLIEQAGENAESTVDPFLRLRATTEEMTNAFKELAADAATPLVIELEKLIGVLERGARLLGEDERFRGQVDSLADTAIEVNGIVDALERLQRIRGLDRLGFGFGADFAQAALNEQRQIINEVVLAAEDLEQVERDLGIRVVPSVGNVDGVEGLSREELAESIAQEVLTKDGEVVAISINVDVLARLRELEATEARRLDELLTLDPGLVRTIERAGTAISELTDEERKLAEEAEKAAEANRDFAISAVESSAKVDDFGKIILETADELDLTEDEVLDLALSLGILDEETFQNAQTLIEFNNLLEELAPALAAGGEEAEEAEGKIRDFLDNLPDDDITLTLQVDIAEGVGQDFISEQVDLFTERAEKELELAELTAPTLVPAEVVVARLQAKLDADLTDDVRKEIEERLNEDIPDAERITLEARIDADLSDDERRETLLRIAEIREGGDAFISFIKGTRKEIQGLEEDIKSLNDEIAQNFLRSIFEATVAQEGWTETTLQFGIALGVIDPGIEGQIRGAIQLGEEFDKLVALLDQKGISVGSQAAAEAFNALDLGKTAEEAAAAAVAFETLRRASRNAAREAKIIKDQSLFEIEGIAPPAVEEVITEDRPTLVNLALPEEFKDELDKTSEVIEELTTEELIVQLTISDEFTAELEAILNLIDEIEGRFTGASGGNFGGNVALSQFGNRLQPGQASIVGEARPELIVPQVPVDVLSRVPAGFNNAISGAGARAAVPQQNITNITSNRTTQISNATTNALNIDVPNPTEAIQVVRDIQGGVFIA